MPDNANIEEYRLGKERRKRLFVESGLRPYQIGLTVGVWVYALSIVSAVCYWWSQIHLLGDLVLPGFFVLAWAFHFNYHRGMFRMLAIIAAISLLMSVRHLATDDFCLFSSIGRAMVLVFALILYTKMKDPRLSSVDGA